MSRDLFRDELIGFGDQLGAATRRAEARRRTARRVAGGLASVVVVATAAVLIVPGTSRLDPVAEARAALGARGTILHFRVTYGSSTPWHSGSTMWSSPEEVWSTATGPVRWRVDHAGGTDGCAIETSGMLSFVAPSEVSYADGVEREYSSWSKLVVVSPKDATGKAEPPLPALPQALGSDRDPAAALRSALTRGLLHDGGVRSIGGRSVRVLTGEIGRRATVPDTTMKVDIRTGKRTLAHPGKTIEERPTQLTYTVDADTFAPVELASRSDVQWSTAAGREHYVWIGDTVRFTSFERLAPTAANVQQLSLVYPAGTRIHHTPPLPSGPGHGVLLPRIAPGAMRSARADAQRCEAAEGRPAPLVRGSAEIVR